MSEYLMIDDNRKFLGTFMTILVGWSAGLIISISIFNAWCLDLGSVSIMQVFIIYAVGMAINAAISLLLSMIIKGAGTNILLSLVLLGIVALDLTIFNAWALPLGSLTFATLFWMALVCLGLCIAVILVIFIIGVLAE